jgi:hypothetical protein
MPAFERVKTVHALDRAANAIGKRSHTASNIDSVTYRSEDRIHVNNVREFRNTKEERPLVARSVFNKNSSAGSYVTGDADRVAQVYDVTLSLFFLTNKSSLKDKGQTKVKLEKEDTKK